MDSYWPMVWLLKTTTLKTSNKTNLVYSVIFFTQYLYLTTQPQDASIVLWKPMSISQKGETGSADHQYEALIMMYHQFSTETKYTIYCSSANLVSPPIFFFISVSSITFSRTRMSMGMNKEDSTMERDIKKNWKSCTVITSQNEDLFSSGREEALLFLVRSVAIFADISTS